jgi:glycerol-3-phosphate cytidylyltransferase-like family protein
VVGVFIGQAQLFKKGRNPVFSQEERLEIVANVKVVDEVFIEESLEQKREYVLQHKADILVMGDDWQGKFDTSTTFVRWCICRVPPPSRLRRSSSRSSAILICGVRMFRVSCRAGF